MMSLILSEYSQKIFEFGCVPNLLLMLLSYSAFFCQPQRLNSTDTYILQ